VEAATVALANRYSVVSSGECGGKHLPSGLRLLKKPRSPPYFSED